MTHTRTENPADVLADLLDPAIDAFASQVAGELAGDLAGEVEDEVTLAMSPGPTDLGSAGPARLIRPVPVSAWRDRLARMEPRRSPVAGARRLLVVGAHPQDESLGAGRLVAGFDGPVVAVTLSAGEQCLAERDVDPVDIGVQRIAEWRCAVADLGGTALESRRWPDRGLHRHVADMARLLVSVLEPEDVVLGPWRHEPGSDHRAVAVAVHEAAEAAGARVVEYPVWAPYLLTPHDVQDTGQMLVPVESDGDAELRRRQALGQYLSQLEPWHPGWEPVVPAELVQRHLAQLVAEGLGPATGTVPAEGGQLHP
jgi:LmbE family N-acetylglucosaminyl deacetylase